MNSPGPVPGIDIFSDQAATVLKNRKIALVTGSSNVDTSGRPVYLQVMKMAGQRLKAIWSLQHGFFVDQQDNMILSRSFFWEEMGCKVLSLYGDECLPAQDSLKDIDALLVDVFDVGTRVYTFLNHVVMIMKHLSGRAIDLIVLDRPNPLNGIDHEGNILDEDHFSLVGMLPVPMRHGLTAGEFLSMALTYYDIDMNLEIVKVQKWERQEYFKGIWSYPSPNMPSLNTALVYPGAVIFEATNLSEGRGTTRPFEFVGSPFLDSPKLIDALKTLKLTGVVFVPVFFKPEFSKYSGQVCQGIQVIPQNRIEFKGFQVYYEILRLIVDRYPRQFSWNPPPYEFEYQRLPIDMICGTDFIRKSLEANMPFEAIKADINSGIRDYQDQAANFLLY
jgi:uncharacterized protein YbbC (DUF1343 family)